MNSEAPGKQSVTEECVLGKPSQISGIEKTFLGKDKKNIRKDRESLSLLENL